MTYYLYFSHTGSYYITREELSDEDNYCYECMESDELIGEFTRREELIQLLVMDDAYDEVIGEVIDAWESIFHDGKSN